MLQSLFALLGRFTPRLVGALAGYIVTLLSVIGLAEAGAQVPEATMLAAATVTFAFYIIKTLVQLYVEPRVGLDLDGDGRVGRFHVGR